MEKKQHDIKKTINGKVCILQNPIKVNEAIEANQRTPSGLYPLPDMYVLSIPLFHFHFTSIILPVFIPAFVSTR